MSREQFLVEVIRENHQWHLDYDDVEGYPGSDLHTRNLEALAPLKPRWPMLLNLRKQHKRKDLPNAS
ncbi:hypothetical protein [Mesorhizobium sp. STM 4661]|uniref:hypothetical protein n=1 Tax=Mesorhizobium sp. STM 4661 TaxID=1297570 RepID=UPI0002BE4FEE|nr:hypothetical protein [Mesorhizobium sp. STM 4661]CCV12971.1 hypothetical protein MESS4_510138 [Mesorhizobium sp. STM 4661]